MTTHRHSVSGKATSYTDVPIPSITGLATQVDLNNEITLRQATDLNVATLAKRVSDLEAAVKALQDAPAPTVTYQGAIAP